MTVLGLICPCKTRWHGYMYALIRYIVISKRLREWADDVFSTGIDIIGIRYEFLDESELAVARSIVYVLLIVKEYDQCAQNPQSATGVKYMRNLQSLLDDLAIHAKPEAQQSGEEKARVQSFWEGNKHQRLVEGRCKETVVDFANKLRKSITIRYTVK